MPTKPTPKWKFSVNRVHASVWENDQRFNTQFQVRYKDEKTGDWKDASGFSKSDLPALASAAQYALTLIIGEERYP